MKASKHSRKFQRARSTWDYPSIVFDVLERHSSSSTDCTVFVRIDSSDLTGKETFFFRDEEHVEQALKHLNEERF